MNISFRFIFALMGSIFVSVALQAQEQRLDTLRFSTLTLQEVEIVVFEQNAKLLDIPASVGYLEPQGFSMGVDGISVSEWNSIPGLQFEERSPSSYRINIRGSSFRSPFDVRNIKIYWNGIPITEPGGNTPFNLFPSENFQSVSVIKGPASSVYGAGNGGTLLVESADFSEEKKLLGRVSVGSFGLVRTGLSLSLPHGNLNIHRVQQEGYREHSSVEKLTIEYNQQLTKTESSLWELNTLYTDLFYEIPGGLNLEQFQDNPRQSRPGNPGTEESHSSIDVQNALIGITNQTSFSNHWSISSTGYASMTQFENPFIFDYKKELQTAGGFRSVARFKATTGVLEEAQAGLEYQLRRTSSGNYGNVNGQLDTLNFLDDLYTESGLLFTQLKWRLKEQVVLQTGMSINGLNYDIDRLEDATLDSSYQIRKSFNPEFIPRISLLWNITPNQTLFAHWGKGFSPPTLEEVRTNEGSVNTSLSPESGTVWELGYKRSIDFTSGNLYVEGTGFSFSLDESIVDYTSERGTDLFRNAGGTQQWGWEFLASAHIPSRTNLTSQLQFSYTYHQFQFEEYVTGGDDFSGNRLPGISPHTVSGMYRIQSKNGWVGSAHYLFKNKMPLNNENTDYAPSYHLVDVTVGYSSKYKRGYSLPVDWSIFFHANNLLNQNYSLGVDVNAFGNRYFQPAMGRNFRVSLTVGVGK